jgi:hypothetical protein
MSDSTESTAAIFTHLFRAKDAKLGKEWLDSVPSGWTDESLHHLVVTKGTITASDNRNWISFTMIGINEVFDLFHSTSIFLLEDIHSIFHVLKNRITILNLHSCTLNCGHGLETILKIIAFFTNLTKLHLEGWQIDCISASTLMKVYNTTKVKSLYSFFHSDLVSSWEGGYFI